MQKKATWEIASGTLGREGVEELAVECERKLILPLPGVALRFSLMMSPSPL